MSPSNQRQGTTSNFATNQSTTKGCTVTVNKKLNTEIWPFSKLRGPLPFIFEHDAALVLQFQRFEVFWKIVIFVGLVNLPTFVTSFSEWSKLHARNATLVIIILFVENDSSRTGSAHFFCAVVTIKRSRGTPKGWLGVNCHQIKERLHFNPLTNWRIGEKRIQDWNDGL